MPLITDTQANTPSHSLLQSSTLAPEPIQTVTITEPEYSPTFVDLTWQPRVNLLTHVEGSSWTVTYYSQVLTKDSALSGLQLSASAVYQSYNEIQQLELRVTDALSATQDDQTKAMKVTGSAILAPCIIPNEGDMFIAEIGEGKTAVFRVVQTEKKSIFRESCYQISYELDTDTVDKRQALKTKSVATYYYHKDYFNLGKNPLVTPGGYQALTALGGRYKSVIAQYMRSFFSKEYSTLLIGGQGTPMYDHYVVRHVLGLLNQTDHPELLQVRVMPGQEDARISHPCLWQAVMDQDETLLNVGFRRSGLLSTRYFSGHPALGPLCYSGLDKIVFPVDPLDVVDAQLQRELSPDSLVGSLPGVVLPWTGNNASIGMALRGVNLSALANQSAPIIYPVTQDDYYVLSAHFYTQDITCSALETLTLKHIRAQATDPEQLLQFLHLSQSWPALERFYYVPLLLSLVKSHL
jgi:hypothetical protein